MSMLLAGAAGIMGCGTQRDIYEPNAEQQKQIAYALASGDHGAPTLDYIVRATSRPLYDEHGNAVSVEEFLALLDGRREELQQYAEEGRIYMYTPSNDADDITAEAGAYHEERLSEQREYIALNDQLAGQMYSTLLHEISHDIAVRPDDDPDGNGHGESVDAAAMETDAALAEAAWQARDLPFIASLLAKPLDYAMPSYDAYQQTKDLALSNVRSGEWTDAEARAYLASEFTQDRDAWVREQAARLAEDPITAAIGIDENILITGLERGTLYELDQERFNEASAEFEEGLRELNEARETTTARRREAGHRTGRR